MVDLFSLIIIIAAVFGITYFLIKRYNNRGTYDSVQSRLERLESLVAENEHNEIVTSEKNIDTPSSQPGETATIDNNPLSAMQPPK
jgi:hypothetical protein